MTEHDAKALLRAPTLWELVERRARHSPDAIFAIDDRGDSLDFGEYRERCIDTAAVLAARGIEIGTAVTWMLPTRLTTLVVIGALAKLGAVQNPVISGYRHRELRFIGEQTGAEVLLVPSVFRGVDHEAMAHEVAADLGASSSLRPEVIVIDHELPVASGERTDVERSLRVTSADAVRWVFYTSGSTADPKGARHSDTTLLTAGFGMTHNMAIRSDDRVAMVFPIAHLFGPGWMVASLSSGCTLLVVEQFDPVATPEFLSAHGVTQAAAGTAFHQAYLAAQRRDPSRRLFPEVRAFPGGGAPKPAQLHHDLVREIGGVGIVSGYGMTECPAVTMASPTDSAETLANYEGHALPGVEIRVVAPDGTDLSVGEEGELLVRGPQLFLGYVDEALDEDAFVDGYFRTGDIGFVDTHGNVAITGRLKDIIIRRGENISAKEIEDLLYEHPKVADLTVVGIADPEVGERACAVVCPTDPADPPSFDELVAYLLDHRLMPQKVPEQLEIVDTIPRNVSGKVLKAQLAKRLADSRPNRRHGAAR